MEMKERHVYRTICFVQSSSDFFFYKIQNDGHHLEILCTRNPPPPRPPPSTKKMCFFIKLRYHCLILLVFYLQETNQTQLEESL